MTTVADRALKDLYGKGVADGMEITLSLLLGRESHGGRPFQGPLSPEAQDWATRALEAIHAARRDLE